MTNGNSNEQAIESCAVGRQFLLRQFVDTNFFGTRYTGALIRRQIEPILREDEEITVDFSDVGVTQSFIDEFLGVLVLRNGPDVLNRLVFVGCSDFVKAIIDFVVSSRIDDYRKFEAGGSVQVRR